MQPLTYPLTLFRDALLTTYPQMKHLMCYFHVAKCCKDQLKRCTKTEQKSIMDEVYYLHCSSCQEDFIERYEEIMPRWRSTVPDFADYFKSSGTMEMTSLTGRYFVVNQVWHQPTMHWSHSTKQLKKVTPLGHVTAFQHYLTLSWIG
jgi:hypothetical protein